MCDWDVVARYDTESLELPQDVRDYQIFGLKGKDKEMFESSTEASAFRPMHNASLASLVLNCRCTFTDGGLLLRLMSTGIHVSTLPMILPLGLFDTNSFSIIHTLGG